jgi:hypothetical protein
MPFLKSSKYLCKPNISILLDLKFIFQSYFPNRPPTKSCCRKLLPKIHSNASPQNCGFSKLLFKIVMQNYSLKLFLFPKVVLQTRSTQLFPKAVPRNYFPKLFPKAPQQSGYTKIVMIQTPKLLRKVATERYPPNFRSKASPQSYGFSKLLVEITAQSSSSFPKLLPKDAPPR